VDARTSLLLGLIDLAAQDFAAAAVFLEESARADDSAAVTWRMLGVAYANLDRTDEALRVMDHSLGMEPRSLAGYYNRGLLKLQMRECSGAAVDLDRAWRLDPDNEEVRRLLQVAAACVRSREAGEEEAVPVVRPGGAEAVLPVPTTDMLLEHLEADLADFFAAPRDTVAVPEFADRTTRAVACVDRGDFAGARDLLADHWGSNLTPLEEVILLEAERQLGEGGRLQELVEDALAGDVATTNPYVWTIMLQEARGAPGRWGAGAGDRLLARLMDHAAEFSGRTVREWAQALRRELEEARGVG
jgi:tetratricopeptide (TPR) repeat protein